jgi:hypothetical protein
VTVPVDSADRLVALAQAHGVPLTPLGQTGGTQLSSRTSSRSTSPRREMPGRRRCRRPSADLPSDIHGRDGSLSALATISSMEIAARSIGSPAMAAMTRRAALAGRRNPPAGCCLRG